MALRLAALLLPTLLALGATAGAADGTMRAVRMHAYGGPEVLRLESVPRPQPGPDEVRIRVRAASVNPVDWKLRSGEFRPLMPLELPAIPGRDVAGVVDAVGEAVRELRPGEAVVAFLGRAAQGGYAEFVVVPARDVAAKPRNLSFEEAAAYPLVGLTAWHALITVAGLERGQRVLIHGGAGGVGSAAVQIARWRGAHVTATASERNHDYLRALGADEVIDYRTERFEERAQGLDVVLDTVGGDTLRRSTKVLRPGGTLVSIVGALTDQTCAEARIRCPNPDRIDAGDAGPVLTRLGELAEAGTFRVHLDAVLPLERAGEAQERNREGHTRGKIVLRVAGE